MKYILSSILFICCVLAVYFALHFLFSKDKKYLENRLFSCFCLSSALWSLGFGLLLLQTTPEHAYLWRAIGMIGVFSYLITAQILVCYLANLNKILCHIINGTAFTGIIIYFLVIQKNQVIYHLDHIGMTYSFTPGLCNTMYILYTIVVALNMLAVIIHMILRSNTRRMRTFGKRFLLAEIIIVLGMLFDTIFPLFGKTALPGSSITQFLGLLVLFNAVSFIDRSRINISNMSEFIYYSLAMPVLVYDSGKKLQILNDAAYSFFNIDRNLTGHEDIKISQLFSLSEEEVFTFDGNRKDIDATCLNNQLYCSLAVSEIDDTYGDTTGYIILVTDLSERMKTIQELESAIKEAKNANQAKSTFLANMSHEIRTPMNAIIGFSELVLKMDLSPQVREYVEDIKWSSHNLLAIINDILDISKIESGKMELVCGNYYTENLLNDVSLIISTQARKKGLKFYMNVASDIPGKLFGDKIRIRGVLVNLLNNAVKYTKEGSVALDVNILTKTNETVTLEFKVTDTGIGIKKEDQAVLFESFSQLDQKIHYGVEGSGLGLSIVKGYVTLMGGKLTLESVYGQGSVFTAVIDQKIIDAKPVEHTFSHKEDSAGNNSMGNMKISGVRVLVVDDNQVNLKVAGSTLNYYGLDVDTAASGQTAIELCRTHHYQIVFLDQMMPEMDGIQTMKEIRKSDPYYDYGNECKFIVLTANAISGVRDHLMEEGFDEYLGKPMNFQQLERLFFRFLPPEHIILQEQSASCQENSKLQAEELLYLRDTLSGVEIDQGIANCGGQLKDYLNVLEITWNYGEKQLEELRSMYEQQDYENYTIKIHSMKSMTKNLGAFTLSDLAREQEKAGLDHRNIYIDEHMEEFQTEYRLLLEKIKHVLEHFKILKNTEEEKEILDKKIVLHILLNIMQCIDAFDFSKIFDILEETKKYRLPEPYPEVFGQISHWMDNLDVEQIKSLIEKTLR